MPPKAHAILSASSSDRWLHCPPSARLCETYEDKGSDYAAEGTCAHELCEYKLRKALGLEAADPTENLSWYDEEMEGCANGYAAYVMELVEAAKQTCADRWCSSSSVWISPAGWSRALELRMRCSSAMGHSTLLTISMAWAFWSLLRKIHR